MKFGTSGLRGLVEEMTDERCAAYVSAFIAHLAVASPLPDGILVGLDRRPSSPRIAAACRQTIRRAGIAAIDCGVLPTPALALAAMSRGLPAIMVTGSHIPFDRNGIKFYLPTGEITKADENGILAALAAPLAAADTPGVERADSEARRAYVERAQAFPPAALAGMRVGIHEHSAAGYDLLAEALTGLGAIPVPLGRSTAFVPIDTEAVSEADSARARMWVQEHALAALVTTDGDGDRPLIADETGTFLRGDAVGILTARHLGADAVATPVSSTTALERCGWFKAVRRTKIGSPHVIAAMQALLVDGAGCAVGFEANGGFLLGGQAVPPGGTNLAPLPTRDALLPILSVLHMARLTDQPVSGLSASLPPRATASDRLPEVPVAISEPVVAALADDPLARAALLASLGTVAVTAVDLTDGVRMTLDTDEIVHVRPSGNAPELRCYAEAETAARAGALVSTLLDALRQACNREAAAAPAQ